MQALIRQVDHPLSVIVEPFENDRLDGIELIGHGLDGIHALDKINSLFECFLHLFIW